MFDSSMSELILVFVIGLLILGPERLPKVAAQIGRWVAKARRTANQLRYQLEREVALEEVYKAQKRKPRPGAAKSGSATGAAAESSSDAASESSGSSATSTGAEGSASTGAPAAPPAAAAGHPAEAAPAAAAPGRGEGRLGAGCGSGIELRRVARVVGILRDEHGRGGECLHRLDRVAAAFRGRRIGRGGFDGSGGRLRG